MGAIERPGLGVGVATCGGLGYIPVVPGSVGAAVGVGIVVALARLPVPDGWVSMAVGAGALLVLALGVPAATAAETYFGRKDPGHVIVDEVMGQMIALVASPRLGWKWLLGAYLLFRVFDVVKPFPARRLERLRGGWGIMLDDAAAGFWALAALSILEYGLK
ncbi:MAG TPA: phosphatidylglycerophosphatase A [Terriglobia bacterium]|nr:phosphatidylglycerophosphatase A [Terriglobia bacterium]